MISRDCLTWVVSRAARQITQLLSLIRFWTRFPLLASAWYKCYKRFASSQGRFTPIKSKLKFELYLTGRGARLPLGSLHVFAGLERVESIRNICPWQTSRSLFRLIYKRLAISRFRSVCLTPHPHRPNYPAATTSLQHSFRLKWWQTASNMRKVTKYCI